MIESKNLFEIADFAWKNVDSEARDIDPLFSINTPFQEIKENVYFKMLMGNVCGNHILLNIPNIWDILKN